MKLCDHFAVGSGIFYDRPKIPVLKRHTHIREHKREPVISPQ